MKHTSFGTSTRTDWESTVKNKRDGNNPNAGPGNYNTTNFSALSTNRQNVRPNVSAHGAKAVCPPIEDVVAPTVRPSRSGLDAEASLRLALGLVSPALLAPKGATAETILSDLFALEARCAMSDARARRDA